MIAPILHQWYLASDEITVVKASSGNQRINYASLP
jgi:hypothetical protein